MKELIDTIGLMTSSDYKDRFRAEYLQLSIRINKLCDMIGKYCNNELDFTPCCPCELLQQQLDAMRIYRRLLRERMIIENIYIKEDLQ